MVRILLIWWTAIYELRGSFRSRLLDKLQVTCPNSDSCEENLQRGNLDDHLRYRCSGTLVACQFAGAGCDYRGPSKSMNKHQTECGFKKEGEKKGEMKKGSLISDDDGEREGEKPLFRDA